MKLSIRIVLPLFVVALATQAVAAPIDDWRARATSIRTLMENDAPTAFQEVRQLQADLPAGATAQDRIKVLNLLARSEIYLAETDQAATHVAEALALAKLNHDGEGRIEADLNIALNSVNQGRIDDLVEAVKDGMDALGSTQRTDLRVEMMLRASMMYRRLGQLDESVTIAMQALDIAKHSGDPMAEAYAEQGMAISFEQSARFEEARDHALRMRDAAQTAHSTVLEADAELSLGNLAALAGDVTGGEHQLESAIALYRRVGGPFYVGHALFQLAVTYARNGQPTMALPLLDEDVSIYEERNNNIGLWWTLNTRSWVLQGMGRLDASHADADRAHALADKLGITVYRAGSAKRLAEVIAAEGDFKRAYALSAEAASLTAKAESEKSGEHILQLTQRFQEESRQRRIDELTRRNKEQAQQQRWLWTVFVGSLVIIAVTLYFLLHLRRTHRMLQTSNTQLQRVTNKKQAILDAIPDLLFELGLDGRYYDVHSVRDDLLVKPADQLLGKTVFDVMPPEAAETCLSALHEADENGVSIGKELELPLSQGARWFELSVARKSPVQGENRRYIVLSRDITERKKMEEALAISELEFRTLAENAPDVIIRYDRESRLIYVNPAYEQETGITAGNALGASFEARWRSVGITAEEYLSSLRQVMETGEPIDFVLDWHSQNGMLKYYALRIAAERGPDDEVKGALAMGHNITELKQAQGRLEESRSQLRELIARREIARDEERKLIAREIHDELGQVLTATKLGISTLRLQFGQDNPALIGRIQSLVVLADRSIQVVRDVAYRLRPAALDMGIVSALKWLVSEFEHHAGVPCLLHLPHEMPALDEEHAMAIFRVLQEGLTNIARYAQATQVEFIMEHTVDSCRLELRDNGKGFDLSEISKKSFGLLGMKERVGRLGGTLTLESAPGQGTRIRADMPVGHEVEA